MLAIDYSKLEPGTEISRHAHVLDAGAVGKYRSAVDDSSEVLGGNNVPAFVPPMAIAALSLRGVINDLQIPGGTVHAGQELEFADAVSIGESLDCRATLVQNSTRGEWRFLVVQLQVDDDCGGPVMRGKSTIMVPA